MKVYRKITMDGKGNVLFEDSYEYCGKVALLKGGSTAAMEEQARKSYELQMEEFEFQKSLLAEQQRKTEEEEFRKKLAIEKSLQRMRVGHKETILTGGKVDVGDVLKRKLSA